MAKKKKPMPATATPASVRAGKTLFVYLAPALRDALNDMCDKTRRSLTAEVAIALEEHLKNAGFWPRPKEDK